MVGGSMVPVRLFMFGILYKKSHAKLLTRNLPKLDNVIHK